MNNEEILEKLKPIVKPFVKNEEAFTNLTSLIIEGLSINNFNFPTLSNLMF